MKIKSGTVIITGMSNPNGARAYYDRAKQMQQPLPTTIDREAWFEEFDTFTVNDWLLGEAKFLNSLRGKSYHKNLSAKFRMLNTGKGRCKRPYYDCVSAHKTVYITIGQRYGKTAAIKEWAKQNNVQLTTK